ncbi:MAG: DNA mismatch repair protein MutS [Clostridia bacterium]|nr:DNA mismatch repair protein MutS [Clostridia bacterium]
MSKPTPMIEQYAELKQKQSDAILLFRLGDFYEMFGDDAKIGSRELGIVLTSREAGPGNKMPMCGVPHHAVDSYIATLVQNGHRVAVADQMEDPKLAKGLVRRDIVRVVTPGTLTEQVDPRRNNFLVAVLTVTGGSGAGLAACDASTGELSATQVDGPDAMKLIADEIERIGPSECIYPADMGECGAQGNAGLPTIPANSTAFSRPLTDFDLSRAKSTLLSQFGTASLDGFGCAGMELAVRAAGALVSYIRETQMTSVPQISRMRTYHLGEFMRLDTPARKALDLFGRERGLLPVIDNTSTAMGGRLIRAWLERPSVSVREINERLDAVEELAADVILRGDVRAAMSRIHDLERTCGRIGCLTAGPRDLIGLAASLDAAAGLAHLLGKASSKRVQTLRDELDSVPEASARIRESIQESAKSSPSEGGVIRSGYDEEVDELRKASTEGKEWLLKLEAQEKARTGVKSLKVGFNSVFGYYIEISHANAHLAPDDYIRKQTLANAERFITPALKELESKILGAEERLVRLESAIYRQVLEDVSRYLPRMLETARAIAQLDVLACFAEDARAMGYVRPQVDSGLATVIREARHPVLEKVIGPSRYVPSDIDMACDDARLVIITGPNMAGKSTVLATVGLITLMAQVGSFVPAREAQVGVCDAIYYRTGSYDDISSGKSSFMVELLEVATVLNTATGQSLILMDELGRGTSTYDGMALAWAVAEWIHDQVGARTMFTTHYHELAALEERLPYARNYHVGAVERGGELTFLYRLARGSVDKSYGLNVARMAGLPREVIRRAQQILKDLESIQPSGGRQMTLFGWAAEPPVAGLEAQSNTASDIAAWAPKVYERLRDVDPDGLAAREALDLVYELKAMVEE